MVKSYSLKLACFSATAFLAVCVLVPAKAGNPDALVLKRTIPLPAVHGGFNHMSVDDGHQRLFAPAPAVKMLEVVDLASGLLWRSLPVERPTTALYAPESGQLYLTSRRILSIYDGSTLDRIASLDLGSRLDEIRYDAGAHELFVGRMTDGKTGIAIVAIPEGRLVATIALPSSPQGIAIETAGPRLFVNLPNDGVVAVIDRQKRRVAATWKLKGATDNFPMALDETHERLFLATRTPAEMLVLDTRTGSTITRLRCADDADDMSYDPQQGRIYVSGGGGFVSVIQQHGAAQYQLLEQVRTAPDASNSTLSSHMKSLYVAVPARKGEAAEILVYGTAP